MTNTISGPESMMMPTDWQKMRPDPEKIFEKADANGDGTLDKAEFESFTDRISQRTGQTIDAEEAFAATDTGEDGTIDIDEFIAGGEKMRRSLGVKPPPMHGPMPDRQSSMMDLLSALSETEDEDSLLSSLESTDFTGTLLENYLNNTDLFRDTTGSYSFIA